MSKKTNLFTATTLLALAVGAFLLLSGVQTLIDFNSPLAKAARGLSGLFGADQTSTVVTIVIAILKIVSGGVLLVGPFGLLTSSIRQLAFWVVLGFWAVLTLWLAYQGILQIRGNQETVMQFLQNLALNIVILAALWQTKSEGK